MFTTGNKQLILNKSKNTPVDVVGNLVSVCGFTNFDSTKVLSWSAERFIPGIYGEYTATIGNANTYGVYNNEKKPATFKFFVSSSRYSAEDSIDAIKFKRPYTFSIEIAATDTGTDIANKIKNEIDSYETEFIGSREISASVSGANVTIKVGQPHYEVEELAHIVVGNDYAINETTDVRFSANTKDVGTASLATDGVLTITALNPGEYITSGDTVTVGATTVDILNVISGNTVQTSVTGVTEASGPLSKLYKSNPPTYTGAQLEEEVAMGTYENYGPYEINPGRGPIIDGEYTTIIVEVESSQGGWKPHKGLGPVTQANAVNSASTFKFTISLLEDSDLFSADGHVYKIVNALMTNALDKGNAYKSTGMIATDASDFLA